jgi:hypothetical protein
MLLVLTKLLSEGEIRETFIAPPVKPEKDLKTKIK